MLGRYLSASINATLASIYRPWLLRTLPRLPSAKKKKNKNSSINIVFVHSSFSFEYLGQDKESKN